MIAFGKEDLVLSSLAFLVAIFKGSKPTLLHSNNLFEQNLLTGVILYFVSLHKSATDCDLLAINPVLTGYVPASIVRAEQSRAEQQLIGA